MLSQAQKVRSQTSWADATLAKQLPRDILGMWVKRGAIMIANQARQEFPHGTGAGRSWINATEDDTDIAAYAGVIGPSGTTKGAMPDYMGMIEKGIKPHWVPFSSSYGLKMWYQRTNRAAARAKPKTFWEITRKARGREAIATLDTTKGLMTWKNLASYGGPKRIRTSEGKVAIPWLTRAIEKMLPSIEAELVALARKGPSNMAFQTGVGTVRL